MDSPQHDVPPTTRPGHEPAPSPEPSLPPSTSRPISGPARVQLEQIQQQHQALETLFALTVSALILMSLGLNLFLFKQSRLARGQVAQQGPVVNRAVTEFHKSREPIVRALISGLEDFVSIDQKFQLVIEKYRPYLGQYYMGPKSGDRSTNAPSEDAPVPGAAR